MQTTIAVVFHSDVDLSQSLDWPNLDGTTTTWPPEKNVGRITTWAEREPDLNHR
jgi:hypothetical protein